MSDLVIDFDIRDYLVEDSDKIFDGVNPADYIVLHETDNFKPGADADAHSRLQRDGGGARMATWHWSIDAREAIRSFLETVQCWHAGDGEGKGNLRGVAIEMCVNEDGDYVQTVKNTAKLIRLLRSRGIGTKGILLHKDTSGKNCPAKLIAGKSGITLAEFLVLAGKPAITEVATPPVTGGNRMHSPVKGGSVSSAYGMRGKVRHEGMDIKPNEKRSAPVYASFAGTIVKVVRGRAPKNTSRVNELAPFRTGNGPIVKNSDGEFQLYGHVATLGSLVVGSKVSAGQLLGYMDLSGNTTGYHVHYEEWTAASTLTRPVTRNPQVSFSKFGIKPGQDTGQGATTPVPAPVPTPPAPKPTPPTPTPAPQPQYSQFVYAYQGALKDMGYYKGEHDGIDGSMTKSATLAYQRDQNVNGDANLAEDGIWGAQSDAWYHWTRSLQSALNGYMGRKIRVDGNYGADTRARVREVQSLPAGKRARLLADGIAGSVTTGWMRGLGSSINDRP